MLNYKQFKEAYQKQAKLDKQTNLANLFNTSLNDNKTKLSEQRNKYAFRIKYGASELVLKHKNYLALQVYLELKPFFVSGIFFNDNNKIPYQLLANELRISEINLKRKIAQLRRLKLVTIDNNRNLILAPYKHFYKVIKFDKLKHAQIKTANNYEQTDTIIKSIVYHENINQQNKIIFEKICLSEFSQALQIPTITRDSLSKLIKNDKQKLKLYKSIKKAVTKNFDSFKFKYEKIFLSQYQQLDIYNNDKGTTKILNPNANLPCINAATLINRKSKSCGYKTIKKCVAAGLLRVQTSYLLISRNSPAVYEFNNDLRNDVFAYNYKNKLGLFEKKYFINLPYSAESLMN